MKQLKETKEILPFNKNTKKTQKIRQKSKKRKRSSSSSSSSFSSAQIDEHNWKESGAKTKSLIEVLMLKLKQKSQKEGKESKKKKHKRESRSRSKSDKKVLKKVKNEIDHSRKRRKGNGIEIHRNGGGVGHHIIVKNRIGQKISTERKN